jgi:hypothetical protein
VEGALRLGATFSAYYVIESGDRCVVQWRYEWVDERGRPGTSKESTYLSEGREGDEEAFLRERLPKRWYSRPNLNLRHSVPKTGMEPASTHD